MTVAGFAFAVITIGAGWVAGSAALLVIGFWAFLICFAALLAHDWNEYDAVVNKPLGPIRFGIYDDEESAA